MNQKINCSKIRVGVVFSEPVYFDDGQNMFLAKLSPAKAYHVAALKRWNVPFLLTAGYEVMEGSSGSNSSSFGLEKIADTEVLDELEELEEL